MKLFTAPEIVDSSVMLYPHKIFLAGSIEMGKAIEWQDAVASTLAKKDIALFNPRRKAWDSSWVQSADNPQFKEQVNWEIMQLSIADIAFFYFQPGTQSPITLMELGYVIGRFNASSQFLQGHHVVVVCPDGFWRQGNVEIMCLWGNSGPSGEGEYDRIFFTKNMGEGIQKLITLTTAT